MDRLAIAGLVVGLSLIIFSNIPAFWSVSRSSKLSTTSAATYFDEDGESTESSLKAFADKWPRSSIVALSLVGLTLISVMVTIGTIRRSDEAASPLLWCQAGSWVKLLSPFIKSIKTNKNRFFQLYNLLSSLRSSRLLGDLPLPTVPSGPAWA